MLGKIITSWCDPIRLIAFLSSFDLLADAQPWKVKFPREFPFSLSLLMIDFIGYVQEQ